MAFFAGVYTFLPCVRRVKRLLKGHFNKPRAGRLTCPTKTTSTKMGQQHRKETKRRRRTAYIKRQKEIAKNSKNTAPVQLARKVAEEPAKKAPAKKKAAAAAEA